MSATRYLPLLLCFGLAACGSDSSASASDDDSTNDDDSANDDDSTNDDDGAEPNLDDDMETNGSVIPASDDAGVGDKPDADDESPGGGAPTRPARDVYLSPADISTAVDASAIELWVDGAPGDLGEAKLAELAASVELVSWPELRPIAFGVETTDVSKAADARAHITLAPTETLQSRWYAVVVESLPAGFEWWNAPDSRDEKLARFRTDSMPVVSSVTRCDKGGRSTLTVRFSELVASADAQGVAVEGASCDPLAVGAGTVDSVELTCTVDQQADGLTLTFQETGTEAAKNAWRAGGEGCSEFIPEQLAP